MTLVNILITATKREVGKVVYFRLFGVNPELPCFHTCSWLPDFSRITKLTYVSVPQPHTTQHLLSSWVQITDPIGITSTLDMTFPC